MKRVRTRNQRKRAFKDACLTALMVLLLAAVAVLALRTWAESPAERPVTYEQHIAYIQAVGGDSHVRT